MRLGIRRHLHTISTDSHALPMSMAFWKTLWLSLKLFFNENIANSFLAIETVQGIQISLIVFFTGCRATTE